MFPGAAFTSCGSVSRSGQGSLSQESGKTEEPGLHDKTRTYTLYSYHVYLFLFLSILLPIRSRFHTPPRRQRNALPYFFGVYLILYRSGVFVSQCKPWCKQPKIPPPIDRSDTDQDTDTWMVYPLFGVGGVFPCGRNVFQTERGGENIKLPC